MLSVIITRIGSQISCSNLANTCSIAAVRCLNVPAITMSSLSNEQLRRAEENRQIALAKRRATQTTAAPRATATPKATATSSYATKSHHARGAATAAVAGSRANASWNGRKKVLSAASSASDHQAARHNCRVLSRTHFAVELPYTPVPEVLEVFRNMPSRNYDCTKREWSFALSEYKELIQKCKKLRSGVEFVEIPAKVLQQLLKTPRVESTPPDLGHIGPTLLNSLFPFQREGIECAIARRGRILLADEMGLGKTVQAIALAAYYRNEWPVLIVSPSSVQYMWAKAFLRWIPSLEESEVKVVRTSKDELNAGLINIISYSLLARNAVAAQKCQFQVVILDESHSIKTQSAQRSKAATPIVQKSSRAILLSGTPALSRPSELYSQIYALAPGLLPHFHQYGLRYCAAVSGPYGWTYDGNSNLLELQCFLEATVMLRRLKKDVMEQMPAKSRQVVELDPKTLTCVKKTAKLSQALVESRSRKSEDSKAMLLELYSSSAETKSKAASTYVKELLENSPQKVVIFAHHAVMRQKLVDVIKSVEIDFIKIDGHTSSKAREKACEKFQTDENCRVAVLSITAAGVGITLTAASLVVFAELYWNPGALIQAEDRVYRIGQTRNVSIRYLVAKGTIDDHIWPLVNEKLGVLEQFGVGLGSFKSIDTTKLKSDEEEEQPDLFAYWSDILDIADADAVVAEVDAATDAAATAAAAASCDDLVATDCDEHTARAAGDLCDMPEIDLEVELKDLHNASTDSWPEEDVAASDDDVAASDDEDVPHLAASDDQRSQSPHAFDWGDGNFVASDDEANLCQSAEPRAKRRRV